MFIMLALASLLALSPPPAPETAASKFDTLCREYDGWYLHEFPEVARERGFAIGADRITELGMVPERRRHEQRKLFLSDLDAIEADSLPPHERLDHDLLRAELAQAIEGYDLGAWLTPVLPVSGPHQTVPQLADKVRFEREQDYVDFLHRLEWVQPNLAATIEQMREGITRGRTPPKVVLASVPAQCDAALGGGLDALAAPFLTFPASIPPQRQKELRDEFTNDVMPTVRDALRALRDFVRNEYIPKCRDSVAASDQPDGPAWYAFRLRVETTTTLSAEEIHTIGLEEVARIRHEMLDVIKRTDWYATKTQLADDELFKQFVAYLRSDKRFYFDDAESLLAGYRDICKRIDPHLPRLFGRLPRLPYGVRPVPKFMAAAQTTAYYMPGSIPNGDPGWFYANTHALDQRPKYEMIPLALHEAVPGHHLQIALQQELADVREFRRHADITAFVEGWGLYAERLGIEMNLYQDPYDDFGRLLYEMWRSTRLVVDTGMHALGWPRERAIQYMLDNTALSELNIKNEVDRYISWPGQACAYKLGELTIRRLRAEAESALGPRFSIRAFHDVVLGDGAIPLTVLEANVRRWIEATKAQ